MVSASNAVCASLLRVCLRSDPWRLALYPGPSHLLQSIAVAGTPATLTYLQAPSAQSNGTPGRPAVELVYRHPNRV